MLSPHFVNSLAKILALTQPPGGSDYVRIDGSITQVQTN